MKTLTDDQLAVAIPEAFPELFPDTWKHDSYPEGDKYECDRCDKAWPQKGNDPLTIDKWKCTVPDSIDINDYNVAHKVFRAAWMERGWSVDGAWMERGWAVLQEAMRTIFAKELAEDATLQVFSYFLFHATSADYLRAALLAVKHEPYKETEFNVACKDCKLKLKVRTKKDCDKCINEMPDNGDIVMPKELQGKLFNANSDACDYIVGPCACGAWHELDDWSDEIRATVRAALEAKGVE